MDLSRRQFLATGAAGFTALVTTPDKAFAQKDGMDINDRINRLIKDGRLKLTDQDGNEFNPAVKFKGKPYILVFGLDGCRFCDKISTKLGEIAKAAKDDMPPVVMLDVLPETDNTPKGIASLKENYSEKGIRDVTFAFPASRNQAQLLQTREDGLEAVRNPKDERSHGMRIALVNKDGKCVSAALGTNPTCVDETVKAISGLGRSR